MLKKDVEFVEYMVYLSEVLFSGSFSHEMKVMKKDLNKKQYKYFVKNYKYNFNSNKFEKTLDK